MARAASGALYALSVSDSGTSRPLLLQTSTDGGTSWAPVPFTLNDATSGLNARTSLAELADHLRAVRAGSPAR